MKIFLKYALLAAVLVNVVIATQHRKPKTENEDSHSMVASLPPKESPQLQGPQLNNRTGW